MSSINVKVNPSPTIRVRLGENNAIKVVSGGGGGGGGSLGALSDVDLTNLQDGQLLAYNTITNKFEPVYLDGGTY